MHPQSICSLQTSIDRASYASHTSGAEQFGYYGYDRHSSLAAGYERICWSKDVIEQFACVTSSTLAIEMCCWCFMTFVFHFTFYDVYNYVYPLHYLKYEEQQLYISLKTTCKLANFYMHNSACAHIQRRTQYMHFGKQKFQSCTADISEQTAKSRPVQLAVYKIAWLLIIQLCKQPLLLTQNAVHNAMHACMSHTGFMGVCLRFVLETLSPATWYIVGEHSEKQCLGLSPTSPGCPDLYFHIYLSYDSECCCFFIFYMNL